MTNSQDRHYDRWHPFWDLTPLSSGASRLRESCSPDQNGTAQYPVRALRYWFMYHLIHKEYFALRRPLDVCEVGVGNGAMLSFLRAGDRIREHGALPASVNLWHAVSRNLDETHLTALGYSRLLRTNIEEPGLVLPQQYDVMILLHILEHLYEPERTFANLLPFLKSGGLIIGGFPGLPHLVSHARERRIRKTAEKFGHVSVFSPTRTCRMARTNSLDLEMLTGAYLLRKTDFILERYQWWARLNLLFGALVPFWPGELYWSMRKPSAASVRT